MNSIVRKIKLAVFGYEDKIVKELRCEALALDSRRSVLRKEIIVLEDKIERLKVNLEYLQSERDNIK
jgi:hypothetical protein